MRTRNRSRSGQAGMSMIEVLVALTILVVAFVIALSLYDAARKSFKKGENATEQQQAVRIAFDKLNADLRMAGYNYNPDGDMNRPDEQIEAAYDTAVTIRADFDAEDTDRNTTPETALATGGAFTTVSTGNDEIVTYVLAKPDGSSPDTLTFYADLNSPRNGAVQRVDIPHVALVQDNPPYTLYRVTLSNTDGSPVKTPLVENVRSMTFKYFDQNGVQTNGTFDLTSAAEDIGGAETAATKAQRAGIRRITLSLVGLTRDPDLGWVDPTDTHAATRSFRKFGLQGDVTPRNLGMKGIKDIMADITPPGKPGAPSLYPGHCGGLYMTWPANASSDGVVSYRVNYGTVSGSPSGQRTSTGTSYFLNTLSDNTVYYVTIQAMDAAGNISIDSDERNTRTTNTTTPKAPTSLTATNNLNSSVRLAWDPVTQNTSGVSGDPASPTIRDLGGYRVYRDTSSGFAPAAGNRIANETTVTPQSSPLFLDITAVNCRQYYYAATAVDIPCGVESAPTSNVAGTATSSTKPAAPTNVQAFVTGPSQVRVTWQAVTQDVGGGQITIDKYKVWRTHTSVIDGNDPLLASYDLLTTVTGGALFYPDSGTPSPPAGSHHYYRVSAIDDCPNESDLSLATYAVCAFSGTLAITSPSNGQAVAGVVPVTAVLSGGTDTYTQATFVFTHATLGVTLTQVVTGPGPTWSYNWYATPPGAYTVSVTVQNATGCTTSASINVTSGDIVGCCLSPPNPTQNPVTLTCAGGSTKCKENTYQMINNGCRTAVSIESMTITWVEDSHLTGARLTTVQFDGTTIWSVIPNSASPATATFSAPKPTITLSRTSANPVAVTYIFTSVTGKTQGQACYQDTMTTTYNFRLLDTNNNPTSITGTCGPSQGMFGNLIVDCP
jgi:prepilin-type N-terminal cleavage/methylation domain-containing protein